MNIIIQWENDSVIGELYDTPTARKVWEALPIHSKAHRWGDEVYFNVGIQTKLESNAADVVEPGTICFWVEGSSIAIPFGKTPVSIGEECRLVTMVNVIGTLQDNPKKLSSIKEGMEVKVVKAPDPYT